ncbi:hypothetical protein AGMMS49983_01760 [Clostridia bacterium]|nr:hypothetical protein AGMMS49983_01760 [Clostridia bacterium]
MGDEDSGQSEDSYSAEINESDDSSTTSSFTTVPSDETYEFTDEDLWIVQGPVNFFAGQYQGMDFPYWGRSPMPNDLKGDLKYSYDVIGEGDSAVIIVSANSGPLRSELYAKSMIYTWDEKSWTIRALAVSQYGDNTYIGGGRYGLYCDVDFNNKDGLNYDAVKEFWQQLVDSAKKSKTESVEYKQNGGTQTDKYGTTSAFIVQGLAEPRDLGIALGGVNEFAIAYSGSDFSAGGAEINLYEEAYIRGDGKVGYARETGSMYLTVKSVISSGQSMSQQELADIASLISLSMGNGPLYDPGATENPSDSVGAVRYVNLARNTFSE